MLHAAWYPARLYKYYVEGVERNKIIINEYLIIIINFIPWKSIHFRFVLIQRAVDKLKSFREKVYPEDQDPVHLGDGFPNEQYCTTVLKQYEQTFI